MDSFELKHFNAKRQLELDKKIGSTLALHTPLIYIINKEKRGRKESVASSIYVSYLGNKYIVTAGHTHSKFEYTKWFLQGVDFSFTKDCQGIIYPPQEESYGSINDYSEMDYGIFKLNKDGITKIEKLYTPCLISPDEKNIQLEALKYFVFGYACSQNVQYTTRKPFVGKWNMLRLSLYLGTINSNKYSAERNIALKFTIDNVIKTENIERKAYGRASEPNGLSGCGIWVIPDYPFNEGRYTLQGMLTHYDKNKGLLICFRIQDIIEMIELTEKEIIKLDSAEFGDNIRISFPKKN